MKHFTVIFLILSLANLSLVKAQNKDVLNPERAVMHASVYFDFGKYDLKPGSINTLDLLKEKIIPGKKVEVYVYGHTDWVGGLDYNLWLGNMRAGIVKKYLESKGIKDVSMITRSYGKTKPAASNTTAVGRQKNRRVEIEICFYDQIKMDLTENTEKKPSEKETSMQFEQGSLIKISPDVVAPYNIKEVSFDVQEILTSDAMIKNHATTQDKNGKSLISGGMILINASVNGKGISAAAPYTVNLPVEDYAIDSEMELFTSVNRNGRLVWQKTKIPVKIVLLDGKHYYQFTVSTFGGFNCDKYLRPQPRIVNTPAAKPLEYNIKIRTRYYHIMEAYIYDKRHKSLIYCDSVSGTRMAFNDLNKKFNYRLFIHAKRGNKEYFACPSLNGLEKPLLSRYYIVPKYIFTPLTKKQLDKYFASR
jgi:hypothetical protein